MSKPVSLPALLLSASCLLTACGGGDAAGPAPAPRIDGFSAADGGTPLVGERVRLTASFSGGQGRIEPDIGTVTSGAAIDTPALDRSRRYTLIVEAPGQPAARRELDLAVQYRDRYAALPQPFPVQYHAAVTAADGSVIVIGGSRGQGTMSEAIDRYDPVTRSFARIGSLRTGRSGHTATRLPDGRILVLGGQLGLNIGPVADLVDERNGAASDGGRLVQPRNRHAAVALADGRVLVVGGVNRATVELWDPLQRQFRLVAASMRHPREFPSATLLADGRVLIAGGAHIAAQNSFAEIFDPRSESFTPVATDIVERRSLHQAHRLADGRVLILGGEVVDEAGTRLVPLAGVLQFDPTDGSLRPLAALEQARTLVSSVLTGDEQVLLFGGQDGGLAATPSAGALAPMPQGRAWHTVSRLADGRVLILGGDDENGGPVGTAYLYE
jgi:hypothetical protein